MSDARRRGHLPAIQHVLCPVDLSGPSAKALRHAAALTSAVRGDLTALYVHPHDSSPGNPGTTPGAPLETFAAGVLGAERPIRLLEREGEPVSEILDAAVSSDVVVMGTHGRTGFQRVLLGSVSESVMRRSPRPVLVVPRGVSEDPERAVTFENVLCAVDFSVASVLAVQYAAAISVLAHARLVLAHALEWAEEIDTLPNTGSFSLPSSEDDAIARLGELLTDEVSTSCTLEFAVGYGAPAEEVFRIVRERDVDLIVVGVRRRGAFDLAVFGSTTERLIRSSACAVLTVSAPDGLDRSQAHPEG